MLYCHKVLYSKACNIVKTGQVQINILFDILTKQVYGFVTDLQSVSTLIQDEGLLIHQSFGASKGSL